MLAKLIKHEWKDTWKMPCGLMIVLAFLTLAGIYIINPISRAVPEAGDNTLLNLFFSIYTFSYVVVVLFSSFAVYIYFINRYRKNMYGDEAYLMHTLPVSCAQHILAKVIVATIWFMISVVGVWCSIALFCINLANVEDWNYVWSQFFQLAEEILEDITISSRMPAPLTILIVILIGIFALCSGILQIYLSITIGQQARKRKVLLSFVSFFVICYILGRITFFFNDVLDIGMPYVFFVVLGYELVLCAIFFVTNMLIMQNRLNLE